MLTPSEFDDLMRSSEPQEPTRAQRAQERREHVRRCNVGAGMVQCSCCGEWFYDGGYCDRCNL